MQFEEVYSGYSPRVFRLCMGYTNDAAAAKDLLQEIFLIVWQQLPKFRGEASVGTWIFRIASNYCLRHIQREKRLTRGPMPAEWPELNEPDQQDQLTFLYTCIAGLPETDRIVISLELEDLPQAEIAQITGLSPANVRVRIHRIKEKLTIKFRQREQQS
jgi:RNA polymerase sigma-70 factor (ECF subfamily)